MKAILNAIKTRLNSQLTYLGNRIYFLIDEVEGLPLETEFPCAGLLDGGTQHAEYPSRQIENYYFVEVVFYQQILAVEGSLMGKGNDKAILDIAEDGVAALRDYKLGDSAIEYARPQSEDAAQTLINPAGDIMIAMKKIKMKYTKEASV